ERYAQVFVAADRANVAAKLGLVACRDEDVAMMRALESLLHAAEVDMTIFFRGLADIDVDAPRVSALHDAFYDAEKMRRAQADFDAWLASYATRLREDGLPARERRERMNRANPRYVLRNYLAQQVIDRAEAGEEGGIGELLEVLRRPYDDQPGNETFAQRRPDWARDRAGCSMLSCSS